MYSIINARSCHLHSFFFQLAERTLKGLPSRGRQCTIPHQRILARTLAVWTPLAAEHGPPPPSLLVMGPLTALMNRCSNVRVLRRGDPPFWRAEQLHSGGSRLGVEWRARPNPLGGKPRAQMAGPGRRELPISSEAARSRVERLRLLDRGGAASDMVSLGGPSCAVSHPVPRSG